MNVDRVSSGGSAHYTSSRVRADDKKLFELREAPLEADVVSQKLKPLSLGDIVAEEIKSIELDQEKIISKGHDWYAANMLTWEAVVGLIVGVAYALTNNGFPIGLSIVLTILPIPLAGLGVSHIIIQQQKKLDYKIERLKQKREGYVRFSREAPKIEGMDPKARDNIRKIIDKYLKIREDWQKNKESERFSTNRRIRLGKYIEGEELSYRQKIERIVLRHQQAIERSIDDQSGSIAGAEFDKKIASARYYHMQEMDYLRGEQLSAVEGVRVAAAKVKKCEKELRDLLNSLRGLRDPLILMDEAATASNK